MPPPSRPTCATPGCDCSPTTWPRCGPPWTGRSPTRRRCGSDASRSRASTPRCRAASASWRPPSPRTRRCSPPRRTPGTSSPPCRNASARSSNWPGSGCGTSAPPATTSGPAATRTSWRPRPNGSASRRRSCARRSPTTRSGWPRRSSTVRSWNGSSPPPSGSWWPPPRPSPTGARAWPGSPARSTRHGPGPRAPARRSNASPSRTPTRWAAPSRRRPTWTRLPRSPPRRTGTTPTWTPGTPRRSPSRTGRRQASGR
ncbi:hypothetical protein B0E54_05882 [Micromonospora sp. MH99]|nr:hypothetical protein [Micromonospora sp. MH99]